MLPSQPRRRREIKMENSNEIWRLKNQVRILRKYLDQTSAEKKALQESFHEYLERDKKSKDFSYSQKEKIRKLKKILDFHGIDHKKIFSEKEGFYERAKYGIL
mgnify:CR=1 FL=1